MKTISYPKVRVIDPANAHISAEVRILGWSEMRDMARRAGCRIFEKRVGLITKKFTMRGSEAELQAFVCAAWDSEILGKQFREELTRVT